MPLYEFKCRRCGLVTTTMTYGEQPECVVCKGSMIKLFSFSVPRTFQPHWNSAVGQWVTSQNHFEELLKIKSESNSIQSGIDHNYVPVEWGDAAAFGATEEGVDDFQRFQHDHSDEAIESNADLLID